MWTSACTRARSTGLLGPNGAGKSTLVKIVMTVVRPNKAQGTVLGKPIGHKATLARVGYLPENHRFPPWLTGRQAIEFAGALCKMPRRARKARTAKLLDLMRMTDWAKKRIGTYSKGMQQRIGLAAALVNDPELVILDEPTDGVDPVGRREIRDVLVAMRAGGQECPWSTATSSLNSNWFVIEWASSSRVSSRCRERSRNSPLIADDLS